MTKLGSLSQEIDDHERALFNRSISFGSLLPKPPINCQIPREEIWRSLG